jgi:uncharacterized protein (DUF1778 family)
VKSTTDNIYMEDNTMKQGKVKKTSRLDLRVTEAEREAMERYAAKLGLTMSQAIR